MINLNSRSRLLLLSFHLLLGLSLYNFQFLSTYFGYAIILISTYMIASYPDPKRILPLYFSFYIIGFEVLLRMTKAALFWEFGKYADIYFLFLGLIRGNKKININIFVIFYFILLLPSIINIPYDTINLWRQNVSFNLSGPACLMMSALYISNINISKNEMQKMLFISILPIVAMSVVVIFRMPILETYNFTPNSDFVTSGGYGPNQVSTILGYGFLALILLQVFKKPIFQSKLIDYSLLGLFLGLGLLTFSRGGVLSSIIAIVTSLSIYFFRGQYKTQIFFKTILLLVISLSIWLIISMITDGVIVERYGLKKGEYVENMIMDLTGRAQIYAIDIEIFKDNPITGVGPGQAATLRPVYGYSKIAAAHTEYSRMLSEHGMLGLFSLLLLFGISIYHFFLTQPIEKKLIQNIFGMLALLTMSHSAMRLSMAPFIFGFLFINYKE